MNWREGVDRITLRDWMMATIAVAVMLAVFAGGYELGGTVALVEQARAGR